MGLKVCAAPNCEDIALAGKARCAEHQAQSDAATKRSRENAKLTDAALLGRALYKTRRWVRAAAQYLRRNPLCVDCLELGAVVEAKEVDHIKPHRGDARLFWDKTNWQSLCKSCHSRKTAREVFHQTPGVVE